MTDDRRDKLRGIMFLAWDFRRSEPNRDFADCLRGSWKFVKQIAETAAVTRKALRYDGRMSFSPSLISRPIQFASATQVRGVHADFKAARVTGRIGL